MFLLENTEIIYIAIGITMSVLLFIIVLSMMSNNMLLKKNISLLEYQNHSMLESLEALTTKTQEFGKEYEKLQTDLVVNEHYSSGSGSYGQAIKAVQSGASAEDIVRNYGMIDSEAELLVAIHGGGFSVAA